MTRKYEPTWRSLKTHQTAQWMRDAKFGIYTHWGIYCVPAHRTQCNLVSLQHVPARN